MKIAQTRAKRESGMKNVTHAVTHVTRRLREAETAKKTNEIEIERVGLRQ